MKIPYPKRKLDDWVNSGLVVLDGDGNYMMHVYHGEGGNEYHSYISLGDDADKAEHAAHVIRQLTGDFTEAEADEYTDYEGEGL